MVIDADAHVVETERTWEYMRGKEQAFKPVTVVAKDGTSPGREYWLIGNRAFPKNENVGTGTTTDGGSRGRSRGAARSAAGTTRAARRISRTMRTRA